MKNSDFLKSSVSLVILNWNASDETIECLNNVYDSGFVGAVVIADNNSHDHSVDNFRKWAEKNGRNFYSSFDGDLADFGNAVYLVKNKDNFGFAGGNNPAINFSVNELKSEFVWLLNNDARIDSNTLPKLLGCFSNEDAVGFAGSVIRYFESPDVIQCYGGMVIYKWLGLRRLYKKGSSIKNIAEFDHDEVDALMGASLLIRSDLIRDVGLMTEDYFMYSEEVDWQIRAKARGWRIKVASESFVYHKGGLSTKDNSAMYYYYLYRSSIMLTKRFFPYCLFTAVLFVLVNNFRNNFFKPKQLFFGVKGVFRGLVFKWNPR